MKRMSSPQLSPPAWPQAETSANQPMMKSPAEARRRPVISNLWKDASGYGTAVVLTMTVLTATLHLWEADLAVPLRYAGGDSTLYLMLVKSTVENGWYLDNDRLGAPGGQNLRDFPMPDVLHFGIIKLLGYVFREPVVTANLYYLLPYPLTALTAYFVLRRFALGRLAALAGSVLYACAPYHFCRMIGHPMLAAYYLLPLTTWIIVGLFMGRNPFQRISSVGSKAHWRLWSWETVGAVLVCALTGLAGVYYAFFTCFFLMAAGVSAAFRDRQWAPAGAAAAFILVIVGAIGVALAPNIAYIARNGKNQEAAFRFPAEADVYGLNVSEMLLPIEGHRLHFLARRRAKYLEPPRESASEGPLDSPLGFVASAGFLYLVARFLWRRRDKGDAVDDALAHLTVAAVGLGSIGGLGASFNFYVTPMIRCYNRISIYIAFFALAGLFLMLERLANRFLKMGGASGAYAAGLTAVFLLGAFDQTSPQYIPNYIEAKRQYSSDAEFGRRMEAVLPAGSMVYQLPFVPFPEAGATPTLADYELLRPYLHTHTLRWSYGGMKGRPAGWRQADIAERPLPESLPELADAGFRGIYLDRAGYADNGVAVEAELSRLLGAEPQVSQMGRQVFFDLTGYVQAQRGSVNALP
jgi:phosphoglycerol transferase